jgi:hypothetical protein
MTRECRLCGETKTIELFAKHGSFCKACDAARGRKRNHTPEAQAADRARKRAKYAADPKRELARAKARIRPEAYQRRARAALYLAVKSGVLVRPDRCAECGWVGKPHGHHADYSKPLDVEWLCSICHGKRHRIA